MERASATKEIKERVLEVILHHTDIDMSELCGDDRSDRNSKARALVVYIFNKLGMPYTEIGRIINRDHSTCIYLKKVADNYYRTKYGFYLMSAILDDVNELFTKN